MANNYTYSLWIIPDEAAYSLTKGYIEKLCNEYHLPSFEPHITIKGRIQSSHVSRVRRLANKLSPFRVYLTNKVECSAEYFQCLYIRVHETPELLETYIKVCEIVGSENKSYFPHLSLAYGDLPVPTKHEMTQKLGNIPNIEFEVHYLYMVLASKGLPVSSWKIIERFPLVHSS